jgi:RNA polymerase sigma factor (sigma-70 family)
MTTRRAGPRRSTDAATAVLDAFIRNQIALRHFIGRFIRNSSDVDEIAQEAFLQAFSVEKTEAVEQPKSLLFRIAKHVAVSRLRRKANQIVSYLEDSVDSDVLQTEDSPEDEVSARQTLALHCEAVSALPPQCRQVYLLRKVHGLSHKEIAAQLGIAVSTVEKHLIKGGQDCSRYVKERAYNQRDTGDLRRHG